MPNKEHREERDQRGHDDMRDRERDDSRLDIALLKQKLETLEKSVSALLASSITRVEFTPVKLIVYGLCGSILTGVLGAILTKVLTK